MAVAPVLDTTPLADWPLQTPAHIDHVDGPNDMVARLEGLGICAGREVRLAKRGEPFIVCVYGTRIGLASGVARLIRVTPR